MLETNGDRTRLEYVDQDGSPVNTGKRTRQAMGYRDHPTDMCNYHILRRSVFLSSGYLVAEAFLILGIKHTNIAQ